MSTVTGVSNAIPNPFGGFAPFPNSIMIPFMGAQSQVLGYQFGIGYEMGKRTVKAFPNDLFNNIRAGSDETITVTYDGQSYTMKYNEYISFLVKKNHETAVSDLVNVLPTYQGIMTNLIEESVKIELKKAERTPSAMAEILSALGVSTGEEVKQKLDLLGDAEKALILSLSPILAILYALGSTTSQPPPDPPIEEFCETEPESVGLSAQWAIPTTKTDPTITDTVSIKFSYLKQNSDGSEEDSGIQDYGLDYQTHLENILVFKTAQFDSSLPLYQQINAQRILIEYAKGMRAAYGACFGE